MSYNDIRTTEPPFPTPVSQDDYDALAARLAEYESALKRIADCDYRGNRSMESTIAHNVLRATSSASDALP